jgi:hypothetical protein
MEQGDQLGAGFSIPAAEQRGLHLAAVRPLEQADGGFTASGTDDAPAGAPGDRRHQPPLVRIRIQQQERLRAVLADPFRLHEKRL